MSSTWAGIVFLTTLIAALALVHKPLGDYMARMLTGTRYLAVERVAYRLGGIDAGSEQSWGRYLRSVLSFSAVSVLVLYAFLRVQHDLGHPYAVPQMSHSQAWNTAASFVTNTNWQSYSGENALGYVVQMAGLAVQNFLSAAVGIAVAIALVRGFARNRTDRLGNFWVDLTRICLRLLLPLSIVFAVVFVGAGMIQNFHDYHTITTVAGGQQTLTGGPVASQEVIKELGTNGGGFYNVNSAHPFENPTVWTNWLEIFLLLCISFSLPRTFGTMVGDRRQGRAIVAVMAVLAILSVGLNTAAQEAHHGTVPTAVGAASEGTETRFGVPDSAAFATGTTLTSTGAVDSFHDSYTSLGGATLLLNMMLGEVAPGGTGSGLYGILVLAVITVFVAGLMVGRTPEYLGKKLGGREVKFASLYLLTTPLVALVGTAVAMALPGQRAGMLNTGAHGLSEVLYAFTSAANNNGSAFAGLSVNTVWYNTALGIAMLVGRFLPIIFALGLAGSLARQRPTPASEGTLPTHRLLFVGMLTGVTVIVVALTYFPLWHSVRSRRDCTDVHHDHDADRTTDRPGYRHGYSSASRHRRTHRPAHGVDVAAGRGAQAQPAYPLHQPRHADRRDRRGVHHRLRGREPERVRLADRRLALAHRAVRERRRGGGRRSRQGPGRRAAPGQDRHRRPEAGRSRRPVRLTEEEVPAPQLRQHDRVVCEAGDT